MSSKSQLFADDPADLLCAAYDAIPRMAFRTSIEHWDFDPALDAVSARVEAAALSGATADAARLAAEGDDATRYAVVRGLDRALARVNPLLAGVPSPALAPLALRHARHGRLDTGAAGGALLPRVAGGGRRGQLAEDLADALGAVVRVPAADWAACDHAVLPPWARLTRADRERGLRIAATPMIADPDELDWRLEERRGLRFYRIAPADRSTTRERVERVVRAFDAAGAAIAIVPELCLSPALLDEWRRVLAERPCAAESALRLVLVGTGNIERADPPTNTAVLLDAQTGEVAASQRKIHPFNLAEADVELWGLAERLTAPVDEDLTPGERVTVLEAGGVRLAILVCEDLARLPALAGPLCAHGVSLLLVPVFARPTKDRRWERARAESYGDATGAAIVVANSLVMASILRVAPAGTAIAVGAGTAAVGAAPGPDSAVVFDVEGGVATVDVGEPVTEDRAAAELA
jgi:predicted amidohydrolase